MNTIIGVFLVALLASLVLTPVARNLGMRVGAVDLPDLRKLHLVAIPRSGGLAIFISFVCAVILGYFSVTDVSRQLVIDESFLYAIAGALVVFITGFVDDIHRLGPRIKFLLQILGATFAFWGGVQVNTIFFETWSSNSLILSYGLTVFWFVLLINSINLVDGLDGLAAGVTFFASVVMIVLSVLQQSYLTAMMFAALGGSVLGFLRYNFNPASIFLGDGGSYFIGYVIAYLSIRASVKSQVGAAILIPLIALGVPIFDAILSPIRRFLLGKAMFQPDKGHIHHQLVRLGFSTRKSVFIIYGFSIVLCLYTVLVVNYRSNVSGFLLIIILAVAFVMVRKLGYLEYVALDKFSGWMRDVTDVVGLSRGRRSFLSRQIDMDQAGTMEDLWYRVVSALEMLSFDRAEMCLNGVYKGRRWAWAKGVGSIDGVLAKVAASDNLAEVAADSEHRNKKSSEASNNDPDKIDNSDHLFRIEVPLSNGGGQITGKLFLMKDLSKNPLSPHTFHRIEHLRRTIDRNLSRLWK